jgi:hypothetical protein
MGPSDARIQKLLQRLSALEERDAEHQLELLRCYPFSRKYFLIDRMPDGTPRLHGSSDPWGFTRLELYAYLSRRVAELELKVPEWVNGHQGLRHMREERG